VTPGQITLVEASLDHIDLGELAERFYERAFATDPTLAEMFTTDPAVQRARFAAELGEIVGAIHSIDSFGPAARALGARHRSYGVRAAHYRLMGGALLAALAEVAGDRWTPEQAEAWASAYNLIAETMMMGALDDRAG
jgi:hemoglobin-like flavoprotein